MDHKNLTYFHQPQSLNRRQARWLIDLANFDLKMIHIPGKPLARPDALSRQPDLLPSEDADNNGVTFPLCQYHLLRLTRIEANVDS